ncbi:MAG: hypothetical protein Kow006_10160 [Gammaproteobacteria bacterium]
MFPFQLRSLSLVLHVDLCQEITYGSIELLTLGRYRTRHCLLSCGCLRAANQKQDYEEAAGKSV